MQGIVLLDATWVSYVTNLNLELLPNNHSGETDFNHHMGEAAVALEGSASVVAGN